MRIIEKKAWPEFFEKVKNREKNFDVRLDEFQCNPGDVLILKEWDQKLKKYTGREIKKTIGYVLKTKNIEGCWKKEDIEKHGFLVIGFK